MRCQKADEKCDDESIKEVYGMATLAKPTNRMFIVKEKDAKNFIEDLNKSIASKELLESCKKAGKLFGIGKNDKCQ
jgi:hypothetical protein